MLKLIAVLLLVSPMAFASPFAELIKNLEGPWKSESIVRYSIGESGQMEESRTGFGEFFFSSQNENTLNMHDDTCGVIVDEETGEDVTMCGWGNTTIHHEDDKYYILEYDPETNSDQRVYLNTYEVTSKKILFQQIVDLGDDSSWHFEVSFEINDNDQMIRRQVVTEGGKLLEYAEAVYNRVSFDSGESDQNAPHSH